MALSPIAQQSPRIETIPLIQSLDELKLSESLIFLIYGATGSGKTHWACSSAFEGRSFIINIGGGITTVKNPNFQRIYPKSSLTPILTISEEVNPSKATGFDKVTEGLEYMFNHRLDDFDTVVVDDVTALRRFAMSKAIELGNKVETSKTRNKFSNQDIAIPAIQDYGTEMRYTESFIINLIMNCRETNKNLIMTAHERMTFKKAENPGLPRTVDKRMPGFTGETFPDAVTGHFDCTWLAKAIGAGDTTKYRMQTMGSESEVGNTKWGGIFKAIEPQDPKIVFDFPYVQKRIRDSIK